MKRLSAFLVLLIFCYSRINAQVAYYDAIELKKLTDSGKFKRDINSQEIYFSILRKYLKDPNSVSSPDAIRLIYSQNPFFNSLGLNELTIKSSTTLSPVSFLSSLANFNVTPFADGLVKFLINRAKEELYISFFSQLQDSTKYPEFKILFPNTKLLVDNFKSWEYANIINTLREAFDKDFKSLLANIPKLSSLDSSKANCGKCSEKVKKRIEKLKTFFAKDVGRILLSTFLIGNGFISDEKIPDVIHQISDNDYLGGLPSANNNVKSAIKLFDILSYSVKSNEYGKSYINKDTFLTVMGQDSITRNLYLGLIYQQFKNEDLRIDDVVLADILNRDYTGFVSFVKNTLSQNNEVDLAFQNLSVARKKGESDLIVYWGAIFEAEKEFLVKSTNIQIIDARLRFPEKLKNVFDLSTQTLEIAHDIAVRNYNAVVIGTLNFISKNAGNSDDLSDIKAFFVKYGSFAANVVNSKNSDDVEKAIESVALPVGSATIKKNTSFSVALNGYLGGFYGNEFLKASPGKKWAPITGVYAPVGITASWGLGKGGSISAFGSVIDISAFASYRLNDDTTKALPEVSLKNILAPGLGVIYGFPKFPISIGYTWQYGPMLREIRKTEINASDKPNHRWQFFLAVDIPIINFYTKVK